MANFKKAYIEKHKAAIQNELDLSNVMEIPKMEKITVNMGLGEALQNSKLIESGIEQLKVITGQSPVVTKAKKSISNFKLREGVSIGLKVTMRGNRMYEFWERLVCFALPRVRDFKGLPPKAFDGRGNYTIGLKEQLIFPEINFDKVDRIRGMDITLCTNGIDKKMSFALFKAMNFPFNKEKNMKGSN